MISLSGCQRFESTRRRQECRSRQALEAKDLRRRAQPLDGHDRQIRVRASQCAQKKRKNAGLRQSKRKGDLCLVGYQVRIAFLICLDNFSRLSYCFRTKCIRLCNPLRHHSATSPPWNQHRLADRDIGRKGPSRRGLWCARYGAGLINRVELAGCPSHATHRRVHIPQSSVAS